ncbi:MAG: gamma-glutamyl-gamma-aminobutyrate hydrolase family protein [Gemmatimonadetes bacterium]|nr:gamma-glutamyl-gamma-aminobutyrate hydrolase family protein [Gemmatimonadota bacterium]
MPQPVVALSASSKTAATPAKYARVRLNEAYVRAVQQAGLTPLVVPPSLSTDEARSVIARVDGLLLTGGEDVDPSRYGADRHPATQKSHALRDATELALVGAARDRRLPVFAICRGLQLLNVALGGTLVQDLNIQRPSELLHAHEHARRDRVHEVTITANTRLARAVGGSVIRVNTLHHQAVDRIAPALHVTALAPDDVIEAAESVDENWWVLGVQWHPEELIDTTEPWDRALFAAFATACRG